MFNTLNSHSYTEHLICAVGATNMHTHTDTHTRGWQGNKTWISTHITYTQIFRDTWLHACVRYTQTHTHTYTDAGILNRLRTKTLFNEIQLCGHGLYPIEMKLEKVQQSQLEFIIRGSCTQSHTHTYTLRRTCREQEKSQKSVHSSI